MYWSAGWCCGSAGLMTGEISVLGLRCPCYILDAVFCVNQEKNALGRRFHTFLERAEKVLGDFFCLDETFQ